MALAMWNTRKGNALIGQRTGMVGVKECARVDALGFYLMEGFDKPWLLGEPWQVPQPKNRSECHHRQKQQTPANSFGRIKVL